MKVSGTTTMHAPAGQVWAALTDPAVLVAAIPGCQRLESAGPDAYRFVISAGVASLQGIYTGDVALSDQREPRSFVLTASGAGGPGTVSTSVLVSLNDGADGSTELRYDADAVVGGMIAGVGQRMLAAVGQRMAGEFFGSVDDILQGTAPAAAGPAAGLAPATADAAAAGQAGPDAAPGQGGVYFPPARPGGGNKDFVRGVLAGTAAALAGVAIGTVLGRRNS